MRLRTLFKVLALGAAVRAVLRYQRDSRAARRGPARDPFAPDPSDPVQTFDEVFELRDDPFAVDVQSMADLEAAQDLTGLELDADRIAHEDVAQVEMISVDDLAAARAGGDLYGAHTPAAVDRAHPDSDQAFVEGQNWVEALETSAIEGGAEPEQELSEIFDDADLFRAPHARAGRDTPVADHGSGGRRGL